MKRALSCLDFDQTHRCSPSPKRSKSSPSECGESHLSNSTSQPLRTLPLTPDTLHAHSPQPPPPEISKQLIERWANHCDRCSEPEMAPPQAPSIVSNDSSQRRTSKLSYRRQRSQSPTKSTSIQYRSRNMVDASIFVDHLPDPPSDVEDQLKRIFGVLELDDIGNISLNKELNEALTDQKKIEELAERYCHKSRQMAKDCAGEGQWKSYLLTGLVEPMQELWPDILKLSASEKPWISGLRPSSPSLEDILAAVPPSTHPEYCMPTAGPLPVTPVNTAFPQAPVLGAPSNTGSDATTDDSSRVSIPKPDITLGLAHTSFARLQGKLLWNLQDSNRVLSEPHQSAIGLHFPFIVVEAKGLAIGSNMFGAQNQAAVDGACALNILRDLKLTSNSFALHICTVKSQPRHIVFSLVTEGPIHELWVNYQINEGFHMTLLRIWRTTIKKDCREFVEALCKVFGWGVHDFRAGVVSELTTIEAALRERSAK